jgi:hypothetical protein
MSVRRQRGVARLFFILLALALGRAAWPDPTEAGQVTNPVSGVALTYPDSWNARLFHRGIVLSDVGKGENFVGTVVLRGHAEIVRKAPLRPRDKRLCRREMRRAQAAEGDLA